MLLNKLICSAVFSLLIFALAGPAHGLDDLAVVKGKFKQSRYKNFELDFTKFKVRMAQRVRLPDPKLPGNWAHMNPNQRAQWQKQFADSAAGKALLKKRQDLLAKAPYFDMKVEKDGSYIVYDVPPGVYGLRGREDKEIRGRKFAFEVFGEIKIQKDVDELSLDPIEVTVTPLLESGETAPSFKVNIHNNKAALTSGNFKGSYLFLNFWAKESPLQFQKDIQKMQKELKAKHKFELLSINMDKDRKKAIDFIKKHQLRGRHGFTDGWDHRSLEAYGVRSIPSSWLIDPTGKILMTQFDFRRAFLSGAPSLTKIVDDRIQGKDIPTLAKPPGEDEKAKTDNQPTPAGAAK